MPYIYDYYNIKCFTTNSQSLVTNILARFVNCLVKALNDAILLPRFVVVIPEWDIIRFVKKGMQEDEGIADWMVSALEWIVLQMNRAVESKKDNLKCKKKGAVISNEPKIIWFKMINHLNGNSHAKTLAWRTIFNNELEETLAGKPQHFIADVSQAMMDASLSDRNNSINGFGCVRYCTEVDKVLEWFDKKVSLLKPVSQGQIALLQKNCNALAAESGNRSFQRNFKFNAKYSTRRGWFSRFNRRSFHSHKGNFTR